VRVDRDVRDAVGADGHHRRQLGEERCVGGVGAVVQHEVPPPSHQRPVVHDARRELEHLSLAAVIGREELLAAGEHQAHGPVRGPRQRRHMRLEVELALAAEPSAEVRHDDAHVGLGQLRASLRPRNGR